jgi:hypothetical protein
MAFEKKSDKPKITITCNRCLKVLEAQLHFYKAYTKHCIDGRLPICRDCVKKIVNEDRDNMIKFCESIDLIFVQDYWEQSLKAKSASIANYFRIINMRKLANRPFSESNFIICDEINESQLKYKATPDIENFWGKGLEKSDYYFLQNFYDEFASTYDTSTPVQINLYKNIAKAQLQANKAFVGGDVASYDRLMKSMSNLLADSNLKVKDKDTGLVDTLGLRIKMIESEEPIPKVSDKFKDIDNIGKYFKKFFLDVLINATTGIIDSDE